MDMKPPIGLATLSLALGTVAVVYGQRDNPTETSDVVARSLIDMERQWLEANVTHDPSILERILADNFLGTHQDVSLFTKSQAIAEVKSRTSKVESDHLDDAKVRFFGDVAALYGRETFTVKTDDKVVTGPYVWTDTWLKRSGRWQIVAGQETLLPTKK